MIATAPPSEMARCGRLPRLGFLGVGSIGRQRLASLATSGAASIDVIADPCEGTAQAAARLAPGAAVARTLDELLAADLDGLVIATDGGAHAEQTVAAVEARAGGVLSEAAGTNGRGRSACGRRRAGG